MRRRLIVQNIERQEGVGEEGREEKKEEERKKTNLGWRAHWQEIVVSVAVVAGVEVGQVIIIGHKDGAPCLTSELLCRH